MRRAGRYIGVLIAAIACIGAMGASMRFRTPSRDTYQRQDQAKAAALARSLVDPAVALQAYDSTLDAIGVKALRAQIGVSGLGQEIAVVDTGADPRVFGGANGRAPSRVIDWVDLTGEGDATAIGQYAAEGGTIHLGEIPLNVSGLRSRSGKYIVGALPDVVLSKLDGKRTVYFVVSDPDSAGLYNTVTLDVDSDLNFGNEVSIREFRNDRSYAVLRVSSEQSIAIVASRINPITGKVTFGFDLNGHGTGLSALATGSGVLPGVAPESRVLIIKALNSEGLGNWRDIERGIQEAISAKSSIVLVGSARQQNGDDPEWEQLQSRLASTSSHLVLPAGNAGPGVGTITVSSDSDATVLVSGYLPQASGNLLLDKDLSSDAWYTGASSGPDPKGGRGPMFSAPAVAAVPSFSGLGDTVFSLMEGTSVSSAYAAGALALVRQTQSDAAGNLSKALGFVTAGMAQGASRMPAILPVEQGSGRLDVNASWEILRSRPDHRRMLFMGDWDDSSSPSGIWVKGTTPGAFPVWVDNYAPVARVANLAAEAPWLRTRSERLLMEPVSQRENVVYGTEELAPGFYSADVTADDPATKGVDTFFSVSVSIPQQFDTSGKSSFSVSGEDGAPVARQFIRVPQSAESLALTVIGSAQGQRFSIYSPDGILVRQGLLEAAITTRIGLPKPGLWQICVSGPDGAPKPPQARVEASLEGFFGSDLGSTLQSQFYLVRSPGVRTGIRAAAMSRAAEWRHRSSSTQQTGRSAQLMLPDITQSVEALSVRFGTATGNALRAYLMYFDQATSRWSEVGRALTTTSGVGEMHLPNPKPGRYAVSTEAYGGGPQVYVEMDVNCLVKGGDEVLAGKLPKSLAEGTSTLELPLRADEAEPRLLVIVRQSDLRVIGVLERPMIKTGDIPIVQISGGPDLRTIRAWRRADMKPVNVLVTVGRVSYQLSNGHVTAPIPDGLRPSLTIEEGSRVFLAPSSASQ